ncbi:MAG TPA: ATP-binding protein [Anaerolineae bacterium]|nr:ATP-binding protein [Anaerolineae bacterium]
MKVPTIALLINQTETMFDNTAEWYGFNAAARHFGVNTLLFVGRALNEPGQFKAQANIIYDLVDTERIDGVVIHSGALGWSVGRVVMEAFCARFAATVPVVSVEVPFANIPSVVMSDYKGIRKVMHHLIAEHGYQRIGFIRGPANHVGAEARYQAYQDGMAAANLEIDPEWITTPHHTWWPPPNFEQFAAENKGKFQAMVGASDSLSLAMTQALQKQGLRIPDDVAITGFDDSLESQVAIPPMSTVQPAHADILWQSVALLMKQIRGEAYEDVVTVAPRLLTRRSCGCAVAPPLTFEWMKPMTPALMTPSLVSELDDVWAQATPALLEIGCQLLPEWSAERIEGWLEKIGGVLAEGLVEQKADVFIAALEKILYDVHRLGKPIAPWHDWVSAWQAVLADWLAVKGWQKRAAMMWSQSHRLISEIAAWGGLHQRYEFLRERSGGRDLLKDISVTFGVTALLDVIVQALPKMGLDDFYLSLYERPERPSEQARLILAYRAQERLALPEGGILFETPKLIPEGLMPEQEPFHLIVIPLYFTDKQLGVCLANDVPVLDFDALLRQMSNALHGALLVQKQMAAEQAVSRYARDLEAAAQVGTAVASILDIDQLMQTVVDLIQKRFDFYQVQIFLYEDETEVLTLSHGSGQRGRLLRRDGVVIARGHRSSIVARAARQREGFFVNNVHTYEDYYAHRLIPAVQAELAVPMIAGDKLVGVLDIQAKETERFNLDMVHLQTTLAAQVAIAIENARQFSQKRAALQAAEQARQIAEQANQAKSIFLANMSHELRTPLNAIIGFAQLLEKSQRLSNQDREHVATISRSGSHLLGLINNVLEMSKIEAGHVVEVELKDFDLHRLIAELEEMFGLRCRQKGIRLRVQMAAEVPRYIHSDEMKLRQVLINLISNGIKFTERGEIQVAIAFLSLPEQELWVAVQDTGPGIPLEEMDDLFDTFVQTSAGQASGEGSGLGLAISRRFIRLLGGELWAENVDGKLGRGAVFNFRVPLSQAAGIETAGKVTGIETDEREQRILVVDDNADNRLLLTFRFKEAGFVVKEAGSGREALAIYETWRPDMIWLDIRMPEWDGFETMRRIREVVGDGLQPVIVAVTADAFAEDKERILAAGFDDYVPKPVPEEMVWAKIQHHLGGRLQVTAAEDDSEDESVEEIDWRKVPLATRQSLQQAINHLDIDASLVLLEEVATYEPVGAAFLRDLVNEFRFDDLIALMEQILIE